MGVQRFHLVPILGGNADYENNQTNTGGIKDCLLSKKRQGTLGFSL